MILIRRHIGCGLMANLRMAAARWCTLSMHAVIKQCCLHGHLASLCFVLLTQCSLQSQTGALSWHIWHEAEPLWMLLFAEKHTWHPAVMYLRNERISVD